MNEKRVFLTKTFARLLACALKALVWQDEGDKMWISYDEPNWIAQRHPVANAEAILSKMADLLSAISIAVAGP